MRASEKTPSEVGKLCHPMAEGWGALKAPKNSSFRQSSVGEQVNSKFDKAPHSFLNGEPSSRCKVNSVSSRVIRFSPLEDTPPNALRIGRESSNFLSPAAPFLQRSIPDAVSNLGQYRSVRIHLNCSNVPLRCIKAFTNIFQMHSNAAAEAGL